MRAKRRGGRAARLKRAQSRAATPDEAAPETDRRPTEPAEGRVLVICCGSLARGILALARAKGWRHVDVGPLPARLHHEAGKIPALLRDRIERARPRYQDRILIGYGDCGSGGESDRICRDEGARRIPGPHCYSFLGGNAAFARGADENTTTCYLTDDFVEHFEQLVIADLWIDKHPELLPHYFEHYDKLVYLAQEDDPARDRKARRAAERLGLGYERRLVGWGELDDFVTAGARPAD